MSNDADLRAIKQIYINREIRRKNFFSFTKLPSYYIDNIPLSTVLEDIRANQYLIQTPDPKVIAQLDKIIENHNQTNPFDKLDTNQKDMFENIRIKLPNSYLDVQNDLNKIADELFIKNNLVSKYLNRSTISFWISISALFFSITIAIIQIYQNRTTRLNKLLKEVVSSSLKK